MKSILKFTLVFAAILFIAAFAAPILFQFLPFKFERIFNRIVMILSLIAAIRMVRVPAGFFNGYGLAWSRERGIGWLKAFLLSIFVLGLLLAIRCFWGDAYYHREDLYNWEWPYAFLKALLAGVLVGIIEEFFFRGFVYKTARDKWKWNLVAIVLLTNIFYSLIHFISDKSPFIGPEPTFFDSWKLVAAPFISLMHFDQIWSGALGLYIFGCLLSILTIRAKTLYPAMGLHAGCVFFLKFEGRFFRFGQEQTLLWGSNKMYDGVMGWIFLFLLGAIAILWLGRKRTEIEQAP